MKGTVMSSRLARRLLSCLSVLVAVGTLFALAVTPAYADTNPSLTLRLLKSPQVGQGQSVILPGQMSSAGAGFVFRAVKLDRAKVRPLTDSSTGAQVNVQKKLNDAVASNLAAYRDSSGVEYYGVSDASGVITNDSTARAQGVWLDGAALNVVDGTLSGGVPATFSGTTETPTYWFVTLVAGPKGVAVRTDSSVIQLPTLTGANGAGVFDVTIYPKLAMGGAGDPSHKTVQVGALANTGSTVLLPLLCIVTFLASGLCLSLKNRAFLDKK